MFIWPEGWWGGQTTIRSSKSWLSCCKGSPLYHWTLHPDSELPQRALNFSSHSSLLLSPVDFVFVLQVWSFTQGSPVPVLSLLRSRPNTSTWAEVPFCVFCGTLEPLISLFLSLSTLTLSLQCQPLLFLPASSHRLTASSLRRNTTLVLKWFVNTRWRSFFAIFTTPTSLFRDEVSLAYISKYTTPIPFFKLQQPLILKGIFHLNGSKNHMNAYTYIIVSIK